MRTRTPILACLFVLAAAPTSANAAAADGAPSPHIVVYNSSVSDVDSATEGREHAYGFTSHFRYRHALRGFSARLSPQQVDRLESDPAVDFVSSDGRVSAAGLVPLSAGEPTPPTGLRRIGAADTTVVHQASTVNVAVLDSGIDLSHPDLPSATNGVNCLASAPAQDDYWHGTHVAGTIAAANNGAGVVGVAPGTRLYAAKVLDSTGWGSWSQIICGIDWVTSTRTDSDPSNDVAVANMSLTGTGTLSGTCASTTDALRAAICRSTARGVTYVVAAGNNAKPFDDPASTMYVPAAYPEVLTVTAMSDSDGQPGAAGGAPSCSTTNADDAAATFSNYATTDAGRAHTIAGPGVCIRSTTKGGGYSVGSGTSMATPHIAGAVALCIGEGGSPGPCAGMTPSQIASRMRADAEAHSTAVPTYGFAGDPLNPRAGMYFGFLGWVAGVAQAPPAPADTTPPAIPSGLVAAAGDGSVTLDWNDNATSDGVTAYVVYRATSASGPFAEIGRTSTSTYNNAGLVNGQTYFFRVAAVDGANNQSAASTSVSATPVAPLPNVINLSAVGSKVKGAQQVSLAWTGGDPGAFAVFRDGARISTAQSPDGSGSYRDAIGRKGGGSYVYRVCQVAADGTLGSCSSSVSVTF